MRIDYSIVYSKRKSISIIVERDRTIVVRAPLNTNRELIDREVQKRRFLLLNKINHTQKYEAIPERKEFVSGESIMYLGKNYRLEVVQNEIEGVEFDNRFFISKANQKLAGELFRSWYMRRAEEKIVPKVKHYAKSLGVHFNKISILDLSYRWGSCTPKDNIHFNWRLIKAPLYVVDYIIVHELAHLIEPNHSPEFWNIVSVQLPHYEKAKNWLKEFGSELEKDF